MTVNGPAGQACGIVASYRLAPHVAFVFSLHFLTYATLHIQLNMQLVGMTGPGHQQQPNAV